MEVFTKIAKLKVELDSLPRRNNGLEVSLEYLFRDEWNYHSNNQQESTLSFAETKKLIMSKQLIPDKSIKEQYELLGHNQAVNYITQLIQSGEDISQDIIFRLHTILLSESNAVNDPTLPPKKNRKLNIGEFKKYGNHVKNRAGELQRFTKPEETPQKMSELLDWYRKTSLKQDYPIIKLAVLFHYRYVSIHPFEDGNGRTARLLTNFILMRNGYPPIIVRKEEWVNYLVALQQADNGDLEPFVDLMGNYLVRSLETKIKSIKANEVQDFREFEMELDLLEEQLKASNSKVIVKKSPKAIERVYDFVLTPLINKFANGCMNFFRFYGEAKFSPTSDKNGNFLSKEDSIVYGKMKLDPNNELMIIKCEFRKFKYPGFNIAFTNGFFIQFDNLKYIVSNYNKEVSYEKFYSQNLTETEIDNLIKSEMLRHKSEIERRIQAKKEQLK